MIDSPAMPPGGFAFFMATCPPGGEGLRRPVQQQRRIESKVDVPSTPRRLFVSLRVRSVPPGGFASTGDRSAWREGFASELRHALDS